MIDLHCHILPEIDDGARSLEDSRSMARHAASEGVRMIAATPHVRTDYPTRAARMEFEVDALRRDFAEQAIAVEVLHGAEVELGRLFEISPEELARLTLAQTGRYLLVEFPYRGWPHGFAGAMSLLRSQGIVPLLGHPERNPEVQDRPAVLRELVDQGALVQITAASLDGRLGPAAKLTGQRLLELGLVDVIASDAHGPHIREAGLAKATAAVGDAALARYLTEDVPAAIVAGDAVPAR